MFTSVSTPCTLPLFRRLLNYWMDKDLEKTCGQTVAIQEAVKQSTSPDKPEMTRKTTMAITDQVTNKEEKCVRLEQEPNYSGFSIIRKALCQNVLNTAQITDLVRISERALNLIVIHVHNRGHAR